MWLCQLFLPFYLKNHPNTCSGDAEHTCAPLKSFAGLWRTSNKYKLCPTKIDKSPPSGLTKVLWTEHNVMGPDKFAFGQAEAPRKPPLPPPKTRSCFWVTTKPKNTKTFFFSFGFQLICVLGGWSDNIIGFSCSDNRNKPQTSLPPLVFLWWGWSDLE